MRILTFELRCNRYKLHSLTSGQVKAGLNMQIRHNWQKTKDSLRKITVASWTM